MAKINKAEKLKEVLAKYPRLNDSNLSVLGGIEEVSTPVAQTEEEIAAGKEVEHKTETYYIFLVVNKENSAVVDRVKLSKSSELESFVKKYYR